MTTPGRGINTTSLYLDPTDVPELISWHVKTIRHQIITQDPNNLGSAAAYGAWITTELARLDTILTACGSSIKVIIDLHSPPGGMVVGTPCHMIFNQAWAQQCFLDTWTRIAQHYNGNPKIYGYDILNEPAFTTRGYRSPLKKWPALAKATVLAIRAVEATRITFIEPLYGDVNRLTGLVTTARVLGANVYYSPHFYLPMKFTHQQLPGATTYTKAISYPSSKITKSLLVSLLSPAVAFKLKTGKPVMIGEFSAVRWANSAYTYLRDVIDLFESYGFTWMYQIFRENNCWSLEWDSNRDATAPSPTETPRAHLLKTYFAL